MAKGGYQKQRLEQKKMRAKVARRRARRRKLILTWVATIGALALIVWVALIVLGGDEAPDLASDGDCAEATPVAEAPQTYDAPPEMQIDPAKTYTATFETSCGTMVAELFAGDAPATVNNFVFLAREGYYDGSIFHRVINDFMIQGGDPTGLVQGQPGTSGPGYEFEDENTERSFDEPGLLAMANSGPGTNGSQFFITEVVISHLNAPGQCPGPSGCHSIFGKLTAGMDVLDLIIGAETDPSDRPTADIVINTITIDES